jgi:predicted RNA-binding Zn-ribbon protein involved in translation (DUF1610 family)
MTPCTQCRKKLDPSHDKHWFCPSCKDPAVLLCKGCSLENPACPVCGTKLQFKDDSITKKAFLNPATRGGLGF